MKIETEEEYNKALLRIEELMNLPEGNPFEDELVQLAILVDKYEELTMDNSLPDSNEIIKFRMEQENLEVGEPLFKVGEVFRIYDNHDYEVVGIDSLNITLKALRDGTIFPVLIEEWVEILSRRNYCGEVATRRPNEQS